MEGGEEGQGREKNEGREKQKREDEKDGEVVGRRKRKACGSQNKFTDCLPSSNSHCRSQNAFTNCHKPSMCIAIQNTGENRYDEFDWYMALLAVLISVS